MKIIDSFFANVSRLLKVAADAETLKLSKSERDALATNFGAIVLNGLFFPTAGKILGAGLLLTWFLSELTRSAFVIGLLVPIQYGVALLAQPWIAQWLSGKPRTVPFYRAQALFRTALWCGLAAAVWFIEKQNLAWLIPIFFLIVGGDALAGGLGNIAFNDALARVIPKTLRGRARGWRGVCGALVAGTAGVLINLFISPESGLEIFALLFLIAGILYGLGGLAVGVISEPPKEKAADEAGKKSLASLIREMWKAQRFRRFVAVEALLVPVTRGLVFFTLFGRRNFDLNLNALGLLVLSDAVAPLVGNLIWGKLADKFSNRWVLIFSSVLSVAAPALAVILYSFGRQFSPAAILVAFSLLVFTLGVASVGVDLASKNFILALAPDANKRPVYIGVNDTLIALSTMLPLEEDWPSTRLDSCPCFCSSTSAAG